MNKIAISIVCASSLVWAANTLHTQPRVVSWDSKGNPSEEVIDLSICLETDAVVGDPSHKDAREKYEAIIKYWADNIYEMSNGGNYLGNIKIFSGPAFQSGCDVLWKKNEVWPCATVSGLKNYGQINVADVWKGESVDRRQTDMERFNFAAALSHESMHYIYGFFDEYGTIDFVPDVNNWWYHTYKEFSISADPTNDRIIVEGMSDDYAYKQGWFMPFVKDALVMCAAGKDPDGVMGTLPTGLSAGTYYYIDEATQYVSGSRHFLSVKLRDQSGNPVRFSDVGSGYWGIRLPSSYGTTAHTISNDNWALGSSKYSGCSGVTTQWQWANFSTEFNLNPASKQALAFTDEAGHHYSAWELLVTNPVNDARFGGHERPRYWFKSLIGRQPTESDVYNTTTYFTNYDENTGTWAKGDVDWKSTYMCASKPAALKYMKVELDGKTDAELEALTRKHLNIQWMDENSAEIIVVLDRSGSMSMYNKMQQARIAAEYVANSFSNYSNSPTHPLKVGILAFNDQVDWIYNSDVSGFSRTAIKNALSTVQASGNTALFDALGTAINHFSTSSSSMKLLYVISDGMNNRGNMTVQEVINLYKSKDIAIHTFAYGQDAQRDLLSSMAEQTGGTFYDQQDQFELNAVNAIATVATGSMGVSQIAAASVAPNAKSEKVYIGDKAKIVRVYASYEADPNGSVVNNPIVVLNQNGSAVPASIEQDVVGNRVYVTAEVNLVQHSEVRNSFVEVKNNMAKGLYFRMLTGGANYEYTMQTHVSPEGIFEWPVEGRFMASLIGSEGVLTGLTAQGKLTKPNGTVVTFELYDDGTHGDDIPADGYYHAAMPAIDANGTYQWEITLSNKLKLAHTTRAGTSLPENISFTPYNDKTPVTLINNGQFVVNKCCTDDSHNNPKNLFPENKVVSALQQGADYGKFRIVKTEATKNYVLRLSSSAIENIDKVEIFANSNLMIPVYSVNVEPQLGKDFIVIPLTAEYAKAGNIVTVTGKSTQQGAIYDLLLIETNYESFAIGGFESDQDWHSDQAEVTFDYTRKSEGKSSMCAPAGWKTIDSRNIATSDFEMIGEKMSMDLFIPGSTLNKFWLGEIELWLVVPSSNKRIRLGNQQQIKTIFDNWLTYEFTLSQEAQDILSEPHADARFQIVLNSSDYVWVDNLRFTGAMKVNPVNRYETQCPGGAGCSADNPIRLSVNNSVRVVAEGDLWIEVVDFPENWTPETLKLGMSTEDGSMLTGSLELNDMVYPISNWYEEMSFDYVRGNRYLFKLYNLGDRPYRINAWTVGEVVDVAYAQDVLNNLWNVRF